MTNGVRVVPRDRTMTRAEWKALDSAFRRALRETSPATEQAYADAMVTGVGYFSMQFTSDMWDDNERL